MGDRRRPRSPPLRNPAFASAPVFDGGRYSDLHAVATRHDVFQSPRHSGTSLDAGPVITHYKIKPDILDAPPRDSRARSGSRRSTVDSSSKPIIVTPTRGYNVIVGEPRSAREDEREDRYRMRESGDEAGYLVPAESRGHRRRQSEYRRGRFSIDDTNLEARGPRSSADSLLRPGSVRKQPTYPLADRRPVDRDSIVRHPDTMKDDYGDDGYGYTNPRDMAEYDLDLDGTRDSERRRRRRESWDPTKGGRTTSISCYDDIRRSERREDRERGPPPSTRGFDKLGDRTSIYAAPPMHMPMPHDHITPSPLIQEPLYASDIPQRRSSTRRPVSVYQEPERRVRSDEYEMRDGEPWNNAPRRQDTFDDGIETRGFGIRTDLISASGPAPVTITTSPPSARPQRDDRDDRGPRYERKERDEKRYHDYDRRDRDRDERRDERRDDRPERSERRYEIEDRERDRPSLTTTAGVAAGATGLAAAALGISAPPPKEDDRKRDDDRDREREREERRRRRDEDDEYYRRREERKQDSPPVVDLKGRDPVERRSPVDTRDAETVQRELEENRSRRESPLQTQDEKVDLTDRYPVIERNVAQEEVHYPDPSDRDRDHDRRRREDDYSPRTSPRQDSYTSRDSAEPRRGIPRREKIYHDDNVTAASPTGFSARDTADLRALKEAMKADETTPPPRPPKEPIEETPRDSKRLSRESTDRIYESRTSDTRSSDTRSSDTKVASTPTTSRFNFRDTGDIAALRAEMSHSTAVTSGSSFESSSLAPRGRHDRDSSATPPHSRSSSHERTSRERSTTTLRVVSPPRASSAAPPPKGILKTPKVWPEDPNPVAEGVSLRLDEKTQKSWDGREVADVPKEAKWTKISRRLVNPEALEKGKERFVEREGSVIVLRVLTREEVEGYAVLTREIRATREDEERRDRDRRRREADKDRDTEPRSSHTRNSDEERRERRRRGEETPEEREERRRRRRERHERRRREERDNPDRERDDEREERRRRRKEREREERERERERERAKVRAEVEEDSSSEDSTEDERERREKRDRRRARDEREKERERDRERD